MMFKLNLHHSVSFRMRKKSAIEKKVKELTEEQGRLQGV